MSQKMARRTLLKNMALAGIGMTGAGILGACDQAEATQAEAPVSTEAQAAAPTATEAAAPVATSSTLPEKWDKEADIVIVGGGGTGIVAALEALESQASVIVLEKAAAIGGNTINSSGVVQAAGTKYQKEFTSYQDDTPEKHFQYWNLAAEGIANADLVKAMADGAPGCIEWAEKYGITYINVYGVAPIPYIDPAYMADRIHVPGGGENGASGWGKFYVDTLYAAAQAGGAEFLTDTPVQKVIRDADRGAIGVVALNGDTELYVKARKAVIMATGGYERNEEMAQRYSPHQLWALQTGVSYTAPTNTGDGIRMGMAVGADLAGLGGTIGLPTTNAGIAPTLPGTPEVPGIMVNKRGLRFVAECNHYGYVMRLAFNQESHVAWQIWDANAMELGGAVVSGISGMSADLEKEISEGKVFRADTVKDLAAAIGVDPANLEKTINTWNEDMTTTGVDSAFGKTFGLKAMDKAPYYAVQVVEYNLGTIGGLRINGNAQVIDTEGQVIPRLYAGGQTAGGFMGPYYPGTGTGVIATMYFGRVAAQNAVKEEAWA